MKAFEYCDAVKDKLCIESNYALAKKLGISKQSVARLYAGGTFFPSTAAKVAEILELPEIRVIADSELERCKRPEDRRLWERVAARAAAAVVIGIGIGGIFAGMMPEDPAAPLLRVSDSGTLYIMLNGMASQVLENSPLFIACALIGALLLRRL